MVPQLIHSMISTLTAKTTNSGSLQMIKYIVIVHGRSKRSGWSGFGRTRFHNSYLGTGTATGSITDSTPQDDIPKWHISK